MTAPQCSRRGGRDVDDAVVDCVLEVKGSYKIGKYMPGTLIPVLDETRRLEDQPEYAFAVVMLPTLKWRFGRPEMPA